MARLRGGSGMGFGRGSAAPRAEEQPEGGGGGGFGVAARPAGVYVIDSGTVTWRPALDLNRVILGGQVVGAVALGVLGWAWGRRARP